MCPCFRRGRALSGEYGPVFYVSGQGATQGDPTQGVFYATAGTTGNHYSNVGTLTSSGGTLPTSVRATLTHVTPAGRQPEFDRWQQWLHRSNRGHCQRRQQHSLYRHRQSFCLSETGAIFRRQRQCQHADRGWRYRVIRAHW